MFLFGSFIIVFFQLTFRAYFHSPDLSSLKQLSSSTSGRRPYHVFPFKPHFYIEKLGFAGVNLFFLILFQNIDLGYSLEPPYRGGSNIYTHLCLEQK